VRRFFRGAREDAAPGGAGCPQTPEVTLSGGPRAHPGSGPSPDHPPAAAAAGEIRRRHNTTDPVELAREALDALGEAPNRDEDYSGYLEHQKVRFNVTTFHPKP